MARMTKSQLRNNVAFEEQREENRIKQQNLDLESYEEILKENRHFFDELMDEALEKQEFLEIDYEDSINKRKKKRSGYRKSSPRGKLP